MVMMMMKMNIDVTRFKFCVVVDIEVTKNLFKKIDDNDDDDDDNDDEDDYSHFCVFGHNQKTSYFYAKTQLFC